jgi:RNA polymerase sigma-70 factor (ECF subfamily)
MLSGQGQALSKSNATRKSYGTKPGRDAVSDQELVQSIAKGDQRAMERLFDRHQTQVYRFVLRLVKDEGQAEDVTAETFCQVWRGAAATFKGDSQVPTWLLAIARNLAINTLRRRSTQELDDAAAEAIEDLADNPEVVAAKVQQSAIVARCLKCLSPAHREPIEFFYFQGKSIDEVAKLVGVPLNTVKTRMLRGRVLMAQLLKHFEIECADSMADGDVRGRRQTPARPGSSALLEVVLQEAA